MAKMNHSQCMTRIKAGEDSKLRHKPIWVENIHMFKGLQWTEYLQTLNRSFNVKQPKRPWKRNITKNYARATVMTIAAKLTANRPIATVAPANLEHKSKAIARLSERLLYQVWDDEDLQATMTELALWGVMTGAAFLHPQWVSTHGPTVEIEDPITGEVIDEQPEGGVVTDLVTVFDVGLDPLAQNIKECRWAYRKHHVTPNWIKRHLNKNVEGDQGHDHTSHRYAHDPILSGDDELLRKSSVTLYELWDVDNEMHYFFTKDRILFKEKWPHPIPIIMFRSLPNMGDTDGFDIGAGGVWGDTPFSDCVILQKELNATASQTFEMKDRMMSPLLALDAGTDFDVTELTGLGQRIFRYHGQGMKPEMLHLGSVPSSILQIEDRIKQEMYDVMGTHEVSFGQAPGSIQSGRGVALLAEMDASRWGPATRNLGQVVRDLGKAILSLYREYASAPKMLRVIGPSGAFDIEAFSTEEIDSTDVKVQEGSMYGHNKQIRNEQITNMWNMGLLTDRAKTLKMLEHASVEEAVGMINEDRLKQRREMARIKDGETVQVNEFDDDAWHLDELEPWLKSADFEDQPDNVQQAALEHWRAHRQRLQQMQQQQQMAADTRGTAFAGASGASAQSGEQVFQPQNNNGLDRAAEANPVGAAMGQ